MIELYLNNTRIELAAKTAFSLTRQINNFGELKDRQATFTSQFDIPPIKSNIETLQGLGISNTRIQYFKQSARLVIHGITVVSNGSAIIKDILSVAVYDDNIHFSDALGDKTLSELDLSELNHDLTTGNFTGSFTRTDYIYAISDFGNFNPSAIVINNQLPSLFVKYLWDKIHSEAGFTKDFEPDADLIITPKRGYDTVEDLGTATEIEASGENNFQGYLGQGYYPINPELIPLQPNQTIGQITQLDGSITVTAQGIYYYSLTSDTSDSFNLFELYINVKVNGSSVAMHDMMYTGTASGQLLLNIGDVVTFEMSGYFELYDYSIVYANVITDVSFYTVVGGSGLTVNIQSFIGEVKQKDFIKDVMQHYCLLSKKTKDAQNIEYKKASAILSDKANALDWSDKFVSNGVSFELDYAQKNLFKYQYRQADGEQFADGVLRIDNTTLKSDKVEATRPYNAPEVSTQLLNGQILRYSPFWEADRDSEGNITSWKVIKGKNYLGRVKKFTESITYKTASGSEQTFTGLVPRLNFDYLNYQNILDENYKEVQQMLNWNKVIKGKVQLNVFEFESFDFFKLVYIKQLGGYFYVNSLKWTNGKEMVDCELIFVPQGELNSTVARIGVYENRDLGSGNIVIQLDGSASRNYEGVEWSVEIPHGADNPTFSDDEIINPTLTIVDDSGNAGDYIITMYLNPKTAQQITSTTKITING